MEHSKDGQQQEEKIWHSSDRFLILFILYLSYIL